MSVGGGTAITYPRSITPLPTTTAPQTTSVPPQISSPPLTNQPSGVPADPVYELVSGGKNQSLIQKILAQIESLKKQIVIQKILAQIESLKKQIAFLQKTPTPNSGGGGVGVPSTRLAFDVKFFADRVWKFSDSIKSLGSNFQSPSVIQKLVGKKWTIPGFTNSTLSNQTRKETPQSILSQPTSLESLSLQAKKSIPTDIVFPKIAGGLVDLPIFLSFNTQGIGTQRFNTLSGSPMNLLIKPSQSARSIRSVVTLKKTNFSKINTFILAQDSPSNTKNVFTASLADLSETNIPVIPYKENVSFVVQRFEYILQQDGIYQANLVSPAVEGEYEITTTIEYDNANIPLNQTKLVMVIDPEGYVYTQLREGRLRIQGAKVSIYQLNLTTKKYELWNAAIFNQKNPIITDESGKYAFLVPPGAYYIKAEAKNFKIWQSANFPVRENNSLHIDIPLKKKNFFERIFGW